MGRATPSGEGLALPRRLSGEESSAGHVEYGIRTQIAAIEDGDRGFRRKNYQLDFPTMCVPLHFGHHTHPAVEQHGVEWKLLEVYRQLLSREIAPDLTR